MNQDTSANLYDFPGREYGIQGRWPSPDPSGMASVRPSNPQSWNRYAYVLNNPLANIDPSGLDCLLANGSPEDITDDVTVDRDTCGDDGGIYVDGSVDTSSLVYDGSGLLSFNFTDSNGNLGTGTFDSESGLLTDGYGNVLFDANDYGSDSNLDSANLAAFSSQLSGQSQEGLTMDLIITAPATVTAGLIVGIPATVAVLDAGGDAIDIAQVAAANNPQVIGGTLEFVQGFTSVGSTATVSGVLGSYVYVLYNIFFDDN
jgi:RHS repeat-associated protein